MSKNKVSHSGNGTPLPKARIEKLVVRELPDEVLVYDLKTDKAHCLNQSASLTWKHCDGKTTVADMTSILTAALKTQVDEDTIWLALKQLGKARLLEDQLVTPMEKSRLTRREVIRKLGLGAAIAVPVVMSIVAPTAVSAATCTVNGKSCSPNGTNSKCCSTCCVTNCVAKGTIANGSPCTQPCQCSSGSCQNTPGTCQ